MFLEIKVRRIRRLSHILSVSHDRIPKAVLRWSPAGKSKKGRPKTNWWRTVMAEQEDIGLSWGKASAKVLYYM